MWRSLIPSTTALIMCVSLLLVFENLHWETDILFPRSFSEGTCTRSESLPRHGNWGRNSLQKRWFSVCSSYRFVFDDIFWIIFTEAGNGERTQQRMPKLWSVIYNSTLECSPSLYTTAVTGQSSWNRLWMSRYFLASRTKIKHYSKVFFICYINPTYEKEKKNSNKTYTVGSADFFAIDLYSSAWIAAPENGIEACIANSNDPNWPACNVQQLYDAGTGWPVGIAAELAATWLRATPQNVRHELQQLKKHWSFDKVVRSLSAFHSKVVLLKYRSRIVYLWVWLYTARGGCTPRYSVCVRWFGSD